MSESPPPSPRRRKPRRARLTGPSFNRMLPNLLTLVGLCVGFTAVRFALDGKFGAAAVAIAVSGVIDGLDGRLARLLKATSRFGAEFDSLADFLCFGIAPALVLYLWSLRDWGALGFVPPLMFAACTALRLARFNAALDAAHGPHLPQNLFAYNFFTGVPAPAGAGLALFPLFVGLEAQQMNWQGLRGLVHYPLVTGAVLIGTALLSVSTLPVWSFKNFKVATRFVLPVLLGVVMFAAVALADPWLAFALLGLAYVIMLPFSRLSFLRLQREAEDRLRDDEPV
ncbi:MAG TPA: phosphatidylcholine/phosphatidylserine synthase [Acetobacteraceae bacterium]|nr:phosphatidylcholine/phosphatidylserine synthase [Acetobacteraceae bacterium]